LCATLRLTPRSTLFPYTTLFRSLNDEVPFLVARPLASEEEQRYGHYESSAESYPLYDHCVRALERAATKGPHGLPLMGGGDWNRSEEHTSELQSRENLVCRLLLE